MRVSPVLRGIVASSKHNALIRPWHERKRTKRCRTSPREHGSEFADTLLVASHKRQSLPKIGAVAVALLELVVSTSSCQASSVAVCAVENKQVLVKETLRDPRAQNCTETNGISPSQPLSHGPTPCKTLRSWRACANPRDISNVPPSMHTGSGPSKAGAAGKEVNPR